MTSTLVRANLRRGWAVPVLVFVALASASCAEAHVGAPASADSTSQASLAGLTTSTPGHPKFVTVNVGGASELDGVNNAGTLVGTVYIQGNARGFIKAGVKVTEFGYPGTSEVTVMSGINDAGNSVGHYIDPEGADHGFVRSADGRFTSIDDPHGGSTFYEGTRPMGINDSGIIVGTYVDSHGVTHGFVDTAGIFTTLNEPNAGTTANGGTYIDGINNAGSIIGYYVDSHGVNYGFVDTSGTFTTFSAPGAGKGFSWGTRPAALSSDGIATGYEVGALGISGWVRQGQTFYPCNDPSAASGLTAGTRPAGVSQDGREVVGKYVNSQGAMYGFIAYV